MVFVTPQRVRDLLIEKLQINGSILDFQSLNIERGDTISFSWTVLVRGEDGLLDINDIEFHMPTRRSRIDLLFSFLKRTLIRED